MRRDIRAQSAIASPTSPIARNLYVTHILYHSKASSLAAYTAEIPKCAREFRMKYVKSPNATIGLLRTLPYGPHVSTRIPLTRRPMACNIVTIGGESNAAQMCNDGSISLVDCHTTTDVDTLWDDLDDRLNPTLHANPLPVEIDERRYVMERIKGDRVRAIALSGEPFDVPLGDVDAGLMVGNLHKSSQGIRDSDGKIRSLIRLQIRNFDPGALNHDDASAVFRGMVETLATDCLWLRMPNQQQALERDRSFSGDRGLIRSN